MRLWMWVLLTAAIFFIIGWSAKTAQAKGKLAAFGAGAATGGATNAATGS